MNPGFKYTHLSTESLCFEGSLYTARLRSGENMFMLGMNRGSVGTTADTALASLSRLSYYWPLSWRSLSAIIMGVLLAKWIWILFAPHAIFTSAIPERASSMEAGQLFGALSSSEGATQGVALLNVQLLGVFTASAGKAGFAILKLDNDKQVGVAENDEVVPGTKLIEVNSDHVVTEHAGIRQRVELENKYANKANIKESVPAFGATAGSKTSTPSARKNMPNRPRQ